jgi:hypothetical protein
MAFTKRTPLQVTQTIDPKKTQKFLVKPSNVAAKATQALSLPNSPSVPSEELGNYSWLIYGTKKIGKTSLAAQFPEALFMMFEPGGKALAIYQVDCSTWEKALGYLSLLEKQKSAGTLKYKTIVVDTGFECYQKCFEYVCEKENIEYPRMDNFGKDWKKVSNEFRSFHNRIGGLGTGLVVLCHEKMKESMTRTGNKFDMMVPNLSSAADDYYRAIIDNVAWYHYRNRERFLLLKGTDYALAGTAIQANHKFLTTKGEPLYAIPMGDSAAEGFQYILSAFDNKQTGSYKEDTEKFIEEAVKVSVHKKLKKQGR